MDWWESLGDVQVLNGKRDWDRICAFCCTVLTLSLLPQKHFADPSKGVPLLVVA
jgi:hypothetical protein